MRRRVNQNLNGEDQDIFGLRGALCSCSNRGNEEMALAVCAIGSSIWRGRVEGGGLGRGSREMIYPKIGAFRESSSKFSR